MSASADSIASTASGFIESEGGFAAFLQNVIFGGIAYQLYAQIVDGIAGFGLIIFGPARALGRGLIELVDVFIGGLGDVFGASTQASVESFASGIGASLGIFAQPFGAGIVVITLAVFIYSINNLPISPLSFLQNIRQ